MGGAAVILGLLLVAFFSFKRAGKVSQQKDDLGGILKDSKTAADVDNTVAGMSDGNVTDLLRDKWTRK